MSVKKKQKKKTNPKVTGYSVVRTLPPSPEDDLVNSFANLGTTKPDDTARFIALGSSSSAPGGQSFAGTFSSAMTFATGGQTPVEESEANRMISNPAEYFCPKCGWSPPDITTPTDIVHSQEGFGLELSEPNGYGNSEYRGSWRETWICPNDGTEFGYVNSL